MSIQHVQRGGRPVGVLGDLTPLEARAVLYLRLWSDGAEAQAQILNDFALAYGPEKGRRMMGLLEQFCMLCVDQARRPIIRHHFECECVGGDEACFAHILSSAAEGAREDAMMMASLLVRSEMAPCLVGLALDVGLALRQLQLRLGGHFPWAYPFCRQEGALAPGKLH